ncbi:MAG: replicative DNA helicase [Armatimonadetes bacterium]|nr:replicative DNA helicase [Armatimonadota bacterium]
MERLASAIDKVPPQNLEAEQSTLGSMMIERMALEKGLEMLRAEDFYRPNHQEIFDALTSLSERDEPADLITLQEELRKRGRLEDCGGTEYLMALADAVPTAANVEHYAKIVEQKSILRKLIAAGTEIIGMAQHEDEEVDVITDRAERLIFGVAQRRLGEYFRPITPLVMQTWEWIDRRYHDKGEASGVATGYTRLDHMTSGLQPGDFVIIAARPSMGKTALALNIATNAALKSKQTVALFSIEMSAEQLVQRMVCSQARANAHRLRTGYFQDAEWDRLAKASSELWDAPMYIDDTTDLTALAMRAKCRRLKAEHGLGLVVVDYLQLMRSNRNIENRVQEISEIARSLKSLGRELKVPVIALSQLSRAVERREDKRPMLSDLRESGSIEAEADMVMLLFRPEYYVVREVEDTASVSGEDGSAFDPDKKPETTEIIIAKHRNGPTGTVKLGFIREFASFVNLDVEHNEF